MSEALVHRQVTQYLKLQYPKVLFRTDFAAGSKMTIGQAVRHRELQAGRAWPDLFIAEPVGQFHGLFLELKREGVSLPKAGHIYRSKSMIHMQEQQSIIDFLQSRGYVASFAIGFNEAKKIIDQYLKGNWLVPKSPSLPRSFGPVKGVGSAF